MSKVLSFHWNKISDKHFSFEIRVAFGLCFVLAVQEVALITFGISHCCIVRQKEFSRKTEDS